MIERPACVICDFEGPGVKVEMCAWREAEDAPRFTAEPRCHDRAACRKRVESRGESWPLRDGGEEAA